MSRNFLCGKTVYVGVFKINVCYDKTRNTKQEMGENKNWGMNYLWDRVIDIFCDLYAFQYLIRLAINAIYCTYKIYSFVGIFTVTWLALHIGIHPNF